MTEPEKEVNINTPGCSTWGNKVAIFPLFKQQNKISKVSPPTKPDDNESKPRNELQRKVSGSNVWMYYEKVLDSGNKISSAKCLVCGNTYKTKYGSTSILIKHLEKHPDKHFEFTKSQEVKEAQKHKCEESSATQKTLAEVISKKQKKWPADSTKSEALTTKIGTWIAVNMHPFTIVEEEGFRDIMAEALPSYNVPSRHTFYRRVIPNIYDTLKKDVNNVLQSNLGKIKSLSFTTDIWTSRSMDSFISLTCHFMGDDFEIQRLCLGMSCFHGPKDGKAICEKLKEIVNTWHMDLEDKEIPVYIVTDNGPNVVNAVSRTAWIGISCFSHTLQLVISSARKYTTGMEEILKKARRIVGHYSQSSQARSRLQTIQKAFNNPVLEVVQDVPTRWNSEYAMLERLCKLRSSITAELASAETNLRKLQDSDWALLEGYVEVLAPFEEATREISKEQYPTSSCVIPLLDGVKDKLNIFLGQENSKGKVFAANLLKELDSRFSDVRKQETYLYATVLDPRFKCVLFTNEETSEVTRGLQDETSALQNNDLEYSVDISSDEQEGNSVWDSLRRAAKVACKENHEHDEVTNYLREPIIKKGNPCAWWATNKKKYPALSTLAMRYLSIPASQVSSERMFSAAGNIVTMRRECLNPDTIEKLVFIEQNKQYLSHLNKK